MAPAAACLCLRHLRRLGPGCALCGDCALCAFSCRPPHSTVLPPARYCAPRAAMRKSDTLPRPSLAAAPRPELGGRVFLNTDLPHMHMHMCRHRARRRAHQRARCCSSASRTPLVPRRSGGGLGDARGDASLAAQPARPPHASPAIVTAEGLRAGAAGLAAGGAHVGRTISRVHAMWAIALARLPRRRALAPHAR